MREQTPPPMSDELRPYVEPDEVEEIDAVAGLLKEELPRPTPALRARIHARLSELAGEPRRWRPRRPALLALSYAASGLLLLAVAAIGLAGAGPLGY
jgi:hypothetical protein